MKQVKPGRITVKIGTSIIASSEGVLQRRRLSAWVKDLAVFVNRGGEALLVSSGAVGLGRPLLEKKRNTLAYRQACAAVGQNLLMNAYRSVFARHGLQVAQVLVTAGDLSDRRRYLNLREMLVELLAMKVVPVINENDSVSTMELKTAAGGRVFGDNDKLSALIASKTGSDLLLLLTDVDGLYADNPKTNKSAERIPVIDGFDGLPRLKTSGKSALGRGGMASKLDAVRLASMSGVTSVIASGLRNGVIGKVLQSYASSGDSVCPGTVVKTAGRIRGRRHWIGFSSGIAGVVVINEGAQAALENGTASLLPVGVVDVQGSFAAGSVLSIQNPQGMEIGRGISSFAHTMAARLVGKNSAQIRKLAGRGAPTELIHRDRLVVFQEKKS